MTRRTSMLYLDVAKLVGRHFVPTPPKRGIAVAGPYFEEDMESFKRHLEEMERGGKRFVVAFMENGIGTYLLP